MESLETIQFVFFPFKLKKFIEKPDIIKTNQLMGSWVAIYLV